MREPSNGGRAAHLAKSEYSIGQKTLGFTNRLRLAYATAATNGHVVWRGATGCCSGFPATGPPNSPGPTSPGIPVGLPRPVPGGARRRDSHEVPLRNGYPRLPLCLKRLRSRAGALLLALAALGLGAQAAPKISSLAPESGTATTRVTITGANFGVSEGTGAASLAATEAEPSSWSDTPITPPAPEGAARGGRRFCNEPRWRRHLWIERWIRQEEAG